MQRPSVNAAPLDVLRLPVTTSRDLAASDMGFLLELDPAGGVLTLTLPADLPVGWNVRVVQVGAGIVQFAAGSGVTIRSSSGSLALAGPWASATLYRREASEYVLLPMGGDMGAPVPAELFDGGGDVTSAAPIVIGDGAADHKIMVIGLFGSFPGGVTATRDTLSFLGNARVITSLVAAQSIVINLQNTQGVFHLLPGELFRIENSNAAAWRFHVVWGYVPA